MTSFGLPASQRTMGSLHGWSRLLLRTGAVLLALIPVNATACGGYTEGVASGAVYTITSPNYPANYDRNANCVWVYAATNFTELRVNVSFIQLETNDDGSCKDYLRITEGNSTAFELATLCGMGSSTQLSTLNRYLWIQFRSDFQDQSKGFKLTITAVANGEANSTDSPITACRLTEFSCPNKQCISTSYLCDSVNDCGCDDYGCDETKCWTFQTLDSLGFNWGVGVTVGFAIGLLLLVIFGLYEMPQHKRPDCLKRHRSTDAPENQCLLACTQRCKRNKVDQKKPGDQFKSMLEKMSAGRHPLRWETESESDAGRSGAGSRRTSASGPGSPGGGGSRRSSYQLSAISYGNTLSPTDLPARPTSPAAPSPRSAAAAAAPRKLLMVPATTSV